MATSTTVQLAARIRTELGALADPAAAASARRLIPGTRAALGVALPAIQALARQIHGDVKHISVAEAATLLDHAFERGCREELLLAILLLERLKRQFTAALWADLDRWAGMLGDWEECDQLAARVAAHVLDLAPELSDDLLRWAKSGDPWRRRLTLATAAAMNRQGRARPELATALAFLLIGEEERIVRKAVPWALREACRHDAAAVMDFLRRHKGRLHPTVLREGAKKLNVAQRAQLLDKSPP